jgi:hypothetical protein
MITESKLKSGTLTLGGTGGVGGINFACQATNVRLAPSANETGDEVETLCGDVIGAETTTSWSLAGTSIQDFDNAAGFVLWALEHDLEEAEFVWTPSATSPSWSGKVRVRAVAIGGDVNKRLTTDWEWPLTGAPTMTPVEEDEGP